MFRVLLECAGCLTCCAISDCSEEDGEANREGRIGNGDENEGGVDDLSFLALVLKPAAASAAIAVGYGSKLSRSLW